MVSVPAIAVLSLTIILNPLDAARPHVLVVVTDDPDAAVMHFSFPTRAEADAEAAKFVRGTINRDPFNSQGA